MIPLRRGVSFAVETLARLIAQAGGWPFQLLPLAIVLYWMTLAFFPQTYSIPIPVEQLRSEGLAVVVKLREVAHAGPPLATFRSDSPEAPRASRLELFEDGKRLGPPHAIHQSIRNDGKGRYSHWEGYLRFSASDDTTPILNRRTYRANVPAAPSTALDILAVAAGLLLLRRLWEALVSLMPKLPNTRTILLRCTTPVAVEHESRFLWLTFAFLLSLAWATLAFNWIAGRTITEALASLLPYTDAAGYFSCSQNLVDLGHFSQSPASWCNRRPIYASFLATLMMLGGRHLHVVLLLQSAVICFAIALLIREASRIIGVVPALLLLPILLYFASSHAFPVTMTENAGLAFGATGLALILRGVDAKKLWLSTSGIALMSVALSARAGCLFVLPMLLLWAGLHAALVRRSVPRGIVLALAAIAVGSVASLAVVRLNGGDARQVNSNLSYTLYGMAVGGKGWSQFAADYPEITENSDQEAYRLAWQEVEAHPSVISAVIAKYLVRTWNQAAGLRGGYFPPLRGSLWFLWFFGWIAIALRWREPRHLLIGLISLGSLLSGPFILQDGGIRVFAATIPADALQAAIGLSALLNIIGRTLPAHSSSGSTALKRLYGRSIAFGRFIAETLRSSIPAAPAHAVPRSLVAMPTLLVACVIAAYTPVRHLFALTPISAPPCGQNMLTVTTRLGRESPTLTVDKTGEARAYPPLVSLGSLRSNNVENWFYDWLERPTPYTLGLAYQRWSEADEFGRSFPILITGDTTSLFGKNVRLCLGPAAVEGGPWSEIYKVQTLNVVEGN